MLLLLYMLSIFEWIHRVLYKYWMESCLICTHTIYIVWICDWLTFLGLFPFTFINFNVNNTYMTLPIKSMSFFFFYFMYMFNIYLLLYKFTTFYILTCLYISSEIMTTLFILINIFVYFLVYHFKNIIWNSE